MTDTAETAFLALAADLAAEIRAGKALELELVAPAPAPPRDWRSLGPRALGLAEAANPEYRAHGVTPDRPGHERHCDYCGSTRAELVPGIDGEDGAWTCRDERQCLARKAHRWPPRPDLVPDAVLTALSRADDTQAAQAARTGQQQVQEAAAQAVARQMWHPPGWTSGGPGEGSWDEFGTWHPGLPPASPLLPPPPAVHGAYAHTLMNPHNRTHLLSGQQRPHYYGGHPGYIPPGVVSGAQSAAELPGGTVPAAPQDGGQGAPGPVQGQEGGDVELQHVTHPAALPARPGQQFATPPDGVRPRKRRLRYSGQRPVRKHPQHPPGDSGWGSSGDGPDGASSSAET
jgi:hypothetical protein